MFVGHFYIYNQEPAIKTDDTVLKLDNLITNEFDDESHNEERGNYRDEFNPDGDDVALKIHHGNNTDVYFGETAYIRSQNSTTEIPIKNTIVFVPTLSQERPDDIKKFEKNWIVDGIWPTLRVFPIESFRHPTRGLGCTFSHIVALEKALEMDLDLAVFMEEDAQPFDHLYIPPIFDKLLSNWKMDSPVLFLGGHHIIKTSPVNISSGITYVRKCLGTYGYVVRKHFFREIATLLRMDIRRGGNKFSPDVVISMHVSSNKTQCAVATPLIVDHPKGLYSVNWGTNRPISNWEGRKEWYKIKYHDDKISGNSKSSHNGHNTNTNHKTTRPKILSNFNSPGSSIFHMVISTGGSSFTALNKRTVSSIFYHHPEAHLFIHTSGALTTAHLQNFMERGLNLTIIQFDIEKELRGIKKDIGSLTKYVDPFLKRLKEFKREKYWKNNFSNLVRLLAVYKYGGTYVDTDVIIVNNKGHHEAINAVGREDRHTKNFNNAILWNFRPKNVFIAACLTEFLKNYDGNKWGHNGPRVVTTVEMKFRNSGRSCNRQEIHPNCDVIRLSPEKFQPVPYREIGQVFFRMNESSYVNLLWEQIKNMSYAVHYNHKATHDLFEKELPLGSLAKHLLNDFCLGMDDCLTIL